MDKDITALAGIFATSGVIHLSRPEVYEPLMPKMLPAHRQVIYASGVLELACAAALLHPRTRSLAGRASFGPLLGVYPANLKMAADAARSDKPAVKAAAFGRLPLQLPMLWSARKAARNR